MLTCHSIQQEKAQRKFKPFFVKVFLEERACVSAYTTSWRGTSVVPLPEQKSVNETLQTEISQEVYPWPQIETDPAPRYEEGRFVKSYPTQFPMGVGDLRQSCLRDDYSVSKWAQHKLRYVNGAFVNSSHGHRVTWAIFNESLREVAKQKGRAYHKSTNQNVLTKSELRDLVSSQDDLVKEMASFGADIPTTPMFWKKETNRLQWIVRQMSWSPPWVADKQEDTTREDYEERRRTSIEKSFERIAKQPRTAIETEVHTIPASQLIPSQDAAIVPSHQTPTLVDSPQKHSLVAHPPKDDVANSESLWLARTTGRTVDTYGYGRSPAFLVHLELPLQLFA